MTRPIIPTAITPFMAILSPAIEKTVVAYDHRHATRIRCRAKD